MLISILGVYIPESSCYDRYAPDRQGWGGEWLPLGVLNIEEAQRHRSELRSRGEMCKKEADREEENVDKGMQGSSASPAPLGTEGCSRHVWNPVT